MKKALAVVMIAAAVTGCSSNRSTMIHPDGVSTVDCYARGVGWLGAPLAKASYNRCVREFGVQGWTQQGPEGVDMTIPDTADNTPWSVRKAKYALRDQTIHRGEYDRIVKHIRTVYDMEVRSYKLEYKQDLITKGRYEQKAREALYRYKG